MGGSVTMGQTRPGERLRLDDDTLQLVFPHEPEFSGV